VNRENAEIVFFRGNFATNSPICFKKRLKCCSAVRLSPRCMFKIERSKFKIKDEIVLGGNSAAYDPINRPTSSTDHNVPIPGAGMLVVIALQILLF